MAALFLLSACGTTKPLSLHDTESPIGKGQARIIISRNTSLLYLAAAADVSANGGKIASLGPGGAVVHDLSAGAVYLEVGTFGSFGRYGLRLETVPGKTYKFMVSPRDGNFPLVVGFGMVGDAVNSSGNSQSGYFQIKQVP